MSGGGKVKRKGRGVRGWWGKKMKTWCTWVVGKKGKKKEKKINNVMIKTKTMYQTQFFLKIVISVVKPKLCTKQNFFYNLEFKSGLKFQLQ